jgi:hypothetical protein
VLAFLFFEFGKEADVATCLDLISFTDQGIRKVTHSPEGAKAESAAENLASRSSGGIHDLAQHQRQKASDPMGANWLPCKQPMNRTEGRYL